MTSETTAKNTLSALAFLLAVACLLYLLSIHHLFATTPIPIGVQIAAVLLMLWARMTFGLRSFHATASTFRGGLVTTGPYRHWRHPIYASIIYFVWAGQVDAPSAHAVVGAAGVTVFLTVRMLLEERFLRERYPEYGEYAKRARRYLPFVG